MGENLQPTEIRKRDRAPRPSRSRSEEQLKVRPLFILTISERSQIPIPSVQCRGEDLKLHQSEWTIDRPSGQKSNAYLCYLASDGPHPTRRLDREWRNARSQVTEGRDCDFAAPLRTGRHAGLFGVLDRSRTAETVAINRHCHEYDLRSYTENG